MSRLSVMILALGLGMSPVGVAAEGFDGSAPLLCALADYLECDASAACREVTAESIRAPRFLKIDFEGKQINATREAASERHSAIDHMEAVDGKLILQGVEDGVEGVRDGLGWSLAIAEDTGKLVLSASGDEVGFVAFGACTTP